VAVTVCVTLSDWTYTVVTVSRDGGGPTQPGAEQGGMAWTAGSAMQPGRAHGVLEQAALLGQGARMTLVSTMVDVDLTEPLMPLPAAELTGVVVVRVPPKVAFPDAPEEVTDGMGVAVVDVTAPAEPDPDDVTEEPVTEALVTVALAVAEPVTPLLVTELLAVVLLDVELVEPGVALDEEEEEELDDVPPNGQDPDPATPLTRPGYVLRTTLPDASLARRYTWKGRFAMGTSPEKAPGGAPGTPITGASETAWTSSPVTLLSSRTTSDTAPSTVTPAR